MYTETTAATIKTEKKGKNKQRKGKVRWVYRRK
jgi:hypothetical protein